MWTIDFNPEFGAWSPFIFWYVAINAVLCAIFTLVVVVGGAFDLQYLLRSLREERTDEADDGRAAASVDGRDATTPQEQATP